MYFLKGRNIISVRPITIVLFYVLLSYNTNLYDGTCILCIFMHLWKSFQLYGRSRTKTADRFSGKFHWLDARRVKGGPFSTR